ncbi:hypothetical protein S7711_02953 [Stachybotrys chartarum IBT 7711]|uniref:Uncharacterized protein n=1 Tax=Stachybotrys chartarum (strain CBS 109288 / IBT 7711) TaxID=1280523 RepID=A0A084B2E7_STACB|nr:hypothetical protein S7711_02953 [Stachybotrys chartarum IBT 7711]
MSGLEALGILCNILQLIDFGCKTAIQCKAIYDGNATVDDALQERAQTMMAAAREVKASYERAQTVEAKTLVGIATKCHDIAYELNKEVSAAISSYSASRGRFTSSIRAWARLRRGREKVEKLSKKLQDYTQLMEFTILPRTCFGSSNLEAIRIKQSEDFETISYDLQALVARIATGHTKVQDLVRREHEATRHQITREVQDSRTVVVSKFTNHLNNAERQVARKEQKDRLLRSFKYPEMNQRYNSIKGKQDVSLERLFCRYESMAVNNLGEHTEEPHLNEISLYIDEEEPVNPGSPNLRNEMEVTDRLWMKFVQWLQQPTSGSPFWLQGKPGSGKSTVMKYIADHPATLHHLDHWRPGAQLISHYFWKIGSKGQNSMQGLLATLIYSILSKNRTLIDKIYNTPSWNYESKETPFDWSLGEMEELFLTLLPEIPKPICVFIDGLDETCDADGPAKLLDFVFRLVQIDHIKVCVSSRAEWPFVQRLRHARKLLVQDLTLPDMRVYVRKRLHRPMERSGMSPKFNAMILDVLTHKSSGVFLWLELATRSIMSGMEKGDSESEIRARLDALPIALEALYQDMWARLNDDILVYRARAAEYFRLSMLNTPPFIVNPRSRKLTEHLSGNIHSFMLRRGLNTGKALAEVDQRWPYFREHAERTADDIRKRCAGLLEVDDFSGHDVHPNWWLWCQVRFFHRTAHDFLAETDFGQDLLNSSKATVTNSELFNPEQYIFLAKIAHKHEGFRWNVHDAILRLAEMMTDPGHAGILTSLQEIQALHDGDVLDMVPAWAQQSRRTVLKDDKRTFFTKALRNLSGGVTPWLPCTTKIAVMLISSGADPFEADYDCGNVLHDNICVCHSAFTISLTRPITESKKERSRSYGRGEPPGYDRQVTQMSLKWAMAMEPSKAILEESLWISMHLKRIPSEGDWIRWYSLEPISTSPEFDTLTLTMKVQLGFLLSVLSDHAEEPHPPLIANSIEAGMYQPSLCYILYSGTREGTPDELFSSVQCEKVYLVLDEHPFLDVIKKLFEPSNIADVFTFYEPTLNLLDNPAIVKEIDCMDMCTALVASNLNVRSFK